VHAARLRPWEGLAPRGKQTPGYCLESSWRDQAAGIHGSPSPVTALTLTSASWSRSRMTAPRTRHANPLGTPSGHRANWRPDWLRSRSMRTSPRGSTGRMPSSMRCVTWQRPRRPRRRRGSAVLNSQLINHSTWRLLRGPPRDARTCSLPKPAQTSASCLLAASHRAHRAAVSSSSGRWQVVHTGTASVAVSGTTTRAGASLRLVGHAVSCRNSPSRQCRVQQIRWISSGEW
jgi:hypothetical protein